MNLTNKTIESTYGNVLTIGTTAGTPTQGTLQNGAGQNVTKLVVDEIEANKIIQPQATIAANGTSLATATLLTAGVSLVTSADSNNIAVKLPTSQLGLIINVVNTSTRDISVFPYAATDSILGQPAGTASIVPADNQLYQFICVQNPTVGVWTVTTPFNGVSAVINYKLDLQVDSSSTVSGGRASVSGQNAGVSATVDQIYSNGQVVYRELVLGNSNGDLPIIDMSKFSGYSEFRLKRLSIKTNIPAGPLNSASPTINSWSLLGITSAQFNTLRVRISSQIYDFTVSPNIQMYTVTELDKLWTPYYSSSFYRYISGTDVTVNPALPGQGGYTHYIAVPGDVAYDSSSPSTKYQKFDLTYPSATGTEPFGPSIRAKWKPIYDLFGNLARFTGIDAMYGDGSNPSSGFPAGFEFNSSVEIDWELK
tara:strand:+ start:887 stop:2155 length:1269 start_codon:yes stop_codon:yes gene_type:complete